MATEVYVVKVGGVNGKGNYAEIDLHFLVINASGADWFDESNAILTNMSSIVSGSLGPCLGTDVHVDLLTCHRVYPTGSPTVSQGVNVTGTSSGGNTGSMGVGATIQLFNPSDSRVGHTYLYGAGTSDSSEDQLSGGYSTNVHAFAAAVLGIPNLSNGDSIVWAYKDTLAAPSGFIEVGNYVVLNRVGLKNRRTYPLT
jgi:hypothetical protein